MRVYAVEKNPNAVVTLRWVWFMVFTRAPVALPLCGLVPQHLWSPGTVMSCPSPSLPARVCRLCLPLCPRDSNLVRTMAWTNVTIVSSDMRKWVAPEKVGAQGPLEPWSPCTP